MNAKKFKWAMIIGGIALFLVLILVSPIFFIQDIIIEGNLHVSDADIRSRLGLSASSNILLFNSDAARTRVMGNVYIADVRFRRDLPGRLHVTVLERRLSAYVEHMPGSFLFLDDQGRVLEVRSHLPEPLPILEGLNFTRFQVGEILEVPDSVDFAKIVHYTQLLIAHGIINRVTYIIVSDPTNIRILVRYKEFHLGGISNADEKIRTVVDMLAQLPDDGTIRGSVDLREIRPEYFFSILQ